MKEYGVTPAKFVGSGSPNRSVHGGYSVGMVAALRSCFEGARFRLIVAYFFFCALTFAQRTLCAAAIFLRADADMVRLGFVLPPWPFAALFALRAFCATLIRLRAEAETLRPGFV